ncbi:TetR/AcrR family transcriptional regulator [Caulobacter sp. SSI4214]|uniref:TetR/AcrR family transcriptional regulator n=1 Tax=Caulobacter sp. SSI4214 TaxID=2575739 RepID=UPI00143B15EA|nr:TetR/AcrR family transcriptional regulator [Caulobacter sp. SSI4214]
MKSEKPTATRETIVDAAVQCFERYGVHRTSMADVAEASKVSRQTLYRLFDSRPALLEYIAGQRITALGELLRPYFVQVTSLREALIEGSLRSLKVTASDPLFLEIVGKSGEHRLDQFLLKGSKQIQKLMLSLWGPVLDQARVAGQLRPGITNDQAVEWIRNIHGMLSLRDDYDDATLQQLLTTFLVPSLLIDQA